MSVTNVYLFPWSKHVTESKNKTFTLGGRNLVFMTRSDELKEKVDGVYASYKEGVFYFFKDKNDIVFGWDDFSFCVDEVVSVDWLAAPFYRDFSVLDAEDNASFFRYRRLKNSIFPPWRLLIYLFDSDWGIHSDLPSFVHSSFSGNCGTYEEIFGDFAKNYEYEK